MAFSAGHLTFDPAAPPPESPALGATFRMGTGNNSKRLLLLFPGRPGHGPHLRFAVYMTLTGADGTSAGDLGQLVITGGHLIGMMTYGSAGGARLDERAGSVYVFTASADDLAPATQKTKWTGRAAGVLIRSAPGLQPGFKLEITSVVGALADDGALTFGHSFASLIDALGPEQRRRLQAGDQDVGS